VTENVITITLTDAEAEGILLSTLKNQTLVIGLLNAILAQGKLSMANEAQILEELATANASLDAVNAHITQIGLETTSLLGLAQQNAALIADLQAQIAAGSVVSSPAIDAAIASLKQKAADLVAQATVVDDLVPNAPTP
jgi:hypothetical protein